MTRIAARTLAAAIAFASFAAVARAGTQADANDGPVIPSFAPVVPDAPATTAPAAPDVVSPTTAPAAPDVVSPTTAPAAPDVVSPTTAPAAPDVASPTTAPAAPDVASPTTAPAAPDVAAPTTAPAVLKFSPPKGKYAKTIQWLNMAEIEIRSFECDLEGPNQEKDYLFGALMTGYLRSQDLKSARRVFDELSAESRMFWVGGLISTMLVTSEGEGEALGWLDAIAEGEFRELTLRQLAWHMVKLGSLEGVVLIAKLPKEDRAVVLREWAMALVVEGKLEDARALSQSAEGEMARAAIRLLQLAGQVVHGKKTFDQALAESGRTKAGFMPHLMSLKWAKVRDLDPKLAKAVYDVMPEGSARAGVALGMAMNFIARRRPKAADMFADAMVADLKKTPMDEVSGSVYLDIAVVMAGVGRFDKAKIMFARALRNRSEGSTAQQYLVFFDALIEADGGDMAERLAKGMPGLISWQMPGLWAKFYIKHGQADRVRGLLSKLRTPDQRAILYLGVADGLWELIDKADKAKP